MRSRYTAYVRGTIDHVIASHDPATRGEVDREESEKWSRETEWQGLEIVATDRGGENDQEGTVEFVAKGATTGQPFAHRERATFRRVEGRWMYVDGKTVKPEPIRRVEPAAGRNDPCPCGSGKKFKRCHGA